MITSNPYSYDAVGNLTSVTYPVSAGVAFTYDPLNRLTDMVDGLGTTHYTFDAAGQKLTEGGLFASDTVTNTYSNRKRIALALQQPFGLWTNSFDWDLAGRLSSVSSPAGTFAYGYTALDSAFSRRLRQSLSLPNGAAITNAFDPVARLLATVLEDSGGSPIDGAYYGYNPASQRTASTNAAGAYLLYGYDPIGQLKTALSSVSGENRGYSYDHGWNLNYRTNNGTLQTFGVNSLNELTSSPSGSFAYDANGNLTNGPGKIYRYDDENRLVEVSQGSPTNGAWRSTFAYDGIGRLRVRTEYQGNGTGWDVQNITGYVYDGMRAIQERDYNNAPTTSYTRGPDLSGSFEGAGGIGGLLARSVAFTNCNPLVTVRITNDTAYCLYDLAIWDGYNTYVSGAYIGAGDVGVYTFPGVAGRTYYAYAYSCDYYYIQVFYDGFTATLDTHGVHFIGEEGGTEDDYGLPLCDSASNWLRHDYYFADGNGNITTLIDSGQSVVASYRYDPFGNTLSQSGTLAGDNIYRFSSKEVHSNSGMYYYGYRFYDPSLQRWLNRDPMSDLAGIPTFRRLPLKAEVVVGANLYSAMRNSPPEFYDPLGLQVGPIPLPVIWPILVELGKDALFVCSAVIAGVITGEAIKKATKEDCDKEWAAARKWCAEELAKPPYSRSPKGTGNYTDIETCAKGRVSEECGGTPYERPRGPRGPGPRISW